MSTHGAFGWRLNGVDKVTYNHSDSYPSGLGKKMMEVAKRPLGPMREIVAGIQMVQEGDKPSPGQIEECKHWANLDVSSRNIEEWYVLLRDSQGEPTAWLDEGLKYMIDSKDFLKDSLFCEWAYIINLDSEELEVYQGVNKLPTGRGRYAAFEREGGGGYYGVKLVRRWKLPGKWGIKAALRGLESLE